MKRIRLRDRTGMFRDPKTGFTLVGDEEKALPQNIGDMTRRWLNVGGLVILSGPPVDADNEQEAGLSLIPTPPPPPEAKKPLADWLITELRKLCRMNGIKTIPKDTKKTLLEKLRKAGIS